MARPARGRTLLIAAGVAIALLFGTRLVTPGHWYGHAAAYGAQVDALLAGRTALATSVDGMDQDLAWTPHGTEQVWGLGVPAWRVPFAAIGRAIGLAPFPDRVPLLAWLTLMLCALLRAWRPLPGEPRAVQLGAMLLSGLLPGVVTLMRTRFEIYEEAALYAYGAGMLLLAGVVAMIRRPSRARLWIVVAAAGASGFVRPTVWFYGLATAVIASVIYARQVGVRRALAPIAIAAALFVAGGGALYASNARRFGAGLEFGHALNVDSITANIYATHFDYPFAHVGVVAASAELFGSFVDRPELAHRTSHFAWGQADVVRSREYYFTTFTWTYVPIVLAGFVLGARAWRRRRRDVATAPAPLTTDTLARWLWLWAILGGAPLVAFYLRAPCVASRYQLDLAPAIAALLVVAWRAIARWSSGRGHGAIAAAACVAAWLSAIATATFDRPANAMPLDRATAAAAIGELAQPVASARTLVGAYDLDDPWLAGDTDVGLDFDHCADAADTPIACSAVPLPGDVVRHGERIGREWLLVTRTLVDEPRADACAADDDAAPRACALEPTVRTAVDAAIAIATPPPALYLNGVGWDLVTGRTASVVIAYVDDPAYLEVEVGSVDRAAAPLPWTPGIDEIRAHLGTTPLALVGSASVARGVRLRFAVAPVSRAPGESSMRVLFLAFGRDDELDATETAFVLHRIQWSDAR